MDVRVKLGQRVGVEEAVRRVGSVAGQYLQTAKEARALTLRPRVARTQTTNREHRRTYAAVSG